VTNHIMKHIGLGLATSNSLLHDCCTGACAAGLSFGHGGRC